MPSGRARAWFDLLRPFTLLPPALGMVSGALSAVGAHRVVVSPVRALALAGAGALMAAVLNAASNVLNQVHDLDLDRINKATRPIPAGLISLREARALAVGLYLLALALAFAASPTGVPEVGLIVVFTAILTWAYSAPPFRFRNSWWMGPLVIAVPRGLLLKVAGWGAVAPVFSDREPWMLGLVFFCYVLGAAPTKDFSDVVGDRAGGASSLPIRFGVKRAAAMVAPFLLLPGLLLAAFPRIAVGGRPLLGLPPNPSLIIGAVLMIHGAFVGARMLRDPEILVRSGGRLAWRHMYLLMMELQVSAAALYFARG